MACTNLLKRRTGAWPGEGSRGSGTPLLIYVHVYNFKRKHLLEPPFGIPWDEIFASEEKEKEINLKTHHALYRGFQYQIGQIIRPSCV